MNNKIINIFIFNILIMSMKDEPIYGDYFTEKILQYIGTDKDKDGNEIDFIKWTSFYNDRGELPLKMTKFSIRKFNNFVLSLNLDEVSSEKMIRKYEINSKIEYRINGIHQLLVNEIVKQVDNLFEYNKEFLRELKLGDLLSRD